MLVRIHDVLWQSYANGPGKRSGFWFQGCTLGCPGCFNPATHDPLAGRALLLDDCFQKLLEDTNLEGITISGGEPLQQPEALIAFLKMVRSRTALSSVLLTGYEVGEVVRMKCFDELKECLDVMIAGRYQAGLRCAQGLTGSSNKVMQFFSNRYRAKDFSDIPVAEVIIGTDGSITSSGIDPLRIRKADGNEL